MKKFVIICSAAFAFLAFQAKPEAAATVPAAAKLEFRKMFPQMKPTWVVTKTGSVASFRSKDGSKSFAEYDTKGHFEDAGLIIDNDDAPRPVVITIVKKFPTHKISEIARLVDANSNVVYRVKSSEGKQTYVNYVDSDGKIVKRKG